MLDAHVHRAAPRGIGKVVALVRPWQMVIRIEDVLALGQGRHGVEVIFMRATGVGAHDQFVRLAEGIKRAIDIGIEAVVDLIVVVNAPQHERVGVSSTYGNGPAGEGVFHVLGIFGIHPGHLECPVVTEGVGQVTEDGRAFAALVIPRGIQAGGAFELQVAAVGIARQPTPARGGIYVFIRQAQAERGVRGEVQIKGAVVNLVAAFSDVIKILAGLLGHYGAASQRAGLIQGPAGVHQAAIVVPCARRERELRVRRVPAAFAHKIDPARCAARALHHAGGTAQHLNPVINCHVAVEAVGLYVAAADVQRHAVVLILAAHAKSARVKVLTAHGGVVHGDSGDFLHDLIDGVEVLVIEHFAGDHGDGLWCFFEAV